MHQQKKFLSINTKHQTEIIPEYLNLILIISSITQHHALILVIIFLKLPNYSFMFFHVLQAIVKFFAPTKIFASATKLALDYGGCENFVRRENPLFLDIHPSLGHQISPKNRHQLQQTCHDILMAN